MNKIFRTVLGLVILALAIWGAIALTNLAKDKNIEVENQNSSTSKEKTISVQLIIEAESKGINKSFDLKVEKNSTVFEVMEKAKESGFTFEFSKSDLGILIDEIEGVKNNSEESMYWIYYINGDMAQKGVSDQGVKNNDQIIWLYQGTAV